MLRLCIKLLNQPLLCNVEYLIKCTMMSGCSKRQKQKKQKTKPNPTHLVFCQDFHQWNEWVTAGDTAVCISIRETLVLVVLIVLYSATQTKVKHSLYLLWQSFYNSHLGTPHSLQKLTLSPSRKKKTAFVWIFVVAFLKLKSLLSL